MVGGIDELLQKLEAFCFTYHHLDCLYTLFKYRIKGKSEANIQQVFDNVQRAVYFNRRKRGLNKMRSYAKKEHLEKKVQKVVFELLPKNKINAKNWISFCTEN